MIVARERCRVRGYPRQHSCGTMAQSRTISHAFVMSQVQLSNSRAGLLTLAAPVCCSGIARHSSVVGEHAQSDLSRKLEPYSKTRRPQSWPQIRLRLAENAARQRPTTKNRMHWDRRMEKQVQITVRPPSPLHFMSLTLFSGG